MNEEPPDELVREAEWEKRRQRNALIDPRDPRYDDRFDHDEDEGEDCA